MAITLKSESAQKEVTQLVLDNWKNMKDERSDLEETWKRCLMASLGSFDKKWAAYAKQANRSCRFVELSSDAIDTITPQVFDAAFGPLEWLKMEPLRVGFGQQDDKQAEAMKYLIKFQMRRTGYTRTAKMAIKQLIMLGNCPWGMDWHVRKAVNNVAYNDAIQRWVEESAEYHQEFDQVMNDYNQIASQATLMGGQQPAVPQFQEPPMPPKDMDIVYEGPKLWIASAFNYVQEQHPNDEDKAIRIIRSWRTKSYLKKRAEPQADGYRLYTNLNMIKDMTSEEKAADNDAETLMKMALGMEMPHGKDKVEIKQMHGDFEITQGGEAKVYYDYIVTVANEQLIGCEPSKLYSGAMMVRNARLGIMEGAVYGRGPIEKGLAEQDSANAIHNQSIDAVNCVIAPEEEVIENNLVDGVMKPSGPGVRHMVHEKGTVTPIMKNFQGIPLGLKFLEDSVSRYERFTGSINTATGSSETATRTARNSSVISTKLGSHVVDFEEEFVTPSINMMMEMNAQYIDEDQIVSVTQDGKAVEPIKVSPQDIRRGWMANATGSKYLAEQQERVQNLMMMTQISEQIEATGQVSPIRKAKLYRLLAKEVLGENDDIVMSEEDYEKEKMAKMQYEQAMAEKQSLMEQGGQGEPSGAAGNANGGQEPGAS